MDYAICNACSRRPHGDRGHLDLRQRSAQQRAALGEEAVFACAACATLWHRRSLARGAYLWSLLSAPVPAPRLATR